MSGSEFRSVRWRFDAKRFCGSGVEHRGWPSNSELLVMKKENSAPPVGIGSAVVELFLKPNMIEKNGSAGSDCRNLSFCFVSTNNSKQMKMNEIQT